jgi:threonine/homoserine/homoserine lactone efflux protein
MDILPPWPQFSAFLLASFVLAITPGPGVVYIVARSLVQGRSAGLASVLGVAIGNLGNALAAAFGLAALLAVSSLAFSVVKWAGVAYLFFLGVSAIKKALKAPIRTYAATENMPESLKNAISNQKLIRDGALVSLLNPKTTLFFVAFLPLFMNADAPQMGQSVLLGALFVAIAAVTDTAYVLVAGWVSPYLQRAGASSQRLGQFAMGGVFIGLAAMAALTTKPSK